MSSKDLNLETNNALKDNINQLKAQCKDSYLTITNNTPIELANISSGNKKEKSLCYVEGLRSELESTETPICLDKNLITLQFVNDLKNTLAEVEHFIAYKQGLITEIENETMRLKTLIKSYHEAKVKHSSINEVKPEHVKKAKAHFKEMRVNMKELLKSLFSSAAEDILELIAELVQEYMKPETDGYIEMKSEQFHIAEILKDINLITSNPYNKQQIKICLD